MNKCQGCDFLLLPRAAIIGQATAIIGQARLGSMNDFQILRN